MARGCEFSCDGEGWKQVRVVDRRTKLPYRVWVCRYHMSVCKKFKGELLEVEPEKPLLRNWEAF